MAITFNQATIAGYLGNDPKTSTTQSGHTVTTFSVATTERTSNEQTQAEWHNIVAWNKLAEIAQKYLRKGSCVLIQGRLRTRNYEDKNKVKHYVTEIITDKLQLLDKRTAENDGAAASRVEPQAGYPTAVYNGQAVYQDEPPF